MELPDLRRRRRNRTKRVIAWGLFATSSAGFVASAVGLLAPEEPRIVLLLSWGALWYESVNSLFLTD